MSLTRTATVRLLRTIGIIAVSAVIIAYAIWRSLDYARGPLINVSEPVNGAAVSSNTASVKGRALRLDSLSLNGRSITVDQQGYFNETVIVFPGLNAITLSGRDQFGRSTSKELTIVGTADFPSEENAATATSTDSQTAAPAGTALPTAQNASASTTQNRSTASP